MAQDTEIQPIIEKPHPVGNGTQRLYRFDNGRWIVDARCAELRRAGWARLGHDAHWWPTDEGQAVLDGAP